MISNLILNPLLIIEKNCLYAFYQEVVATLQYRRNNNLDHSINPFKCRTFLRKEIKIRNFVIKHKNSITSDLLD